jgi:hypothetical protein
MHAFSQERWCMPVIPASERLKQENHEFEASLCYIVRLCLKTNELKAKPRKREEKLIKF